MTREGISFDLNSLELLKIRSMRHINKLKENLPGILVESLKGGVSGFLSNLLTFIINNFINFFYFYTQSFAPPFISLSLLNYITAYF